MPTSTIQFRRGTASHIQTANPIPHPGELVLETDTKKFKIGDGVTHYNLLPYVGVPVIQFNILKGSGIGTGKVEIIPHHLVGVPFLIVTPSPMITASGCPATCTASVDIACADNTNLYIKVTKRFPYIYVAIIL